MENRDKSAYPHESYIFTNPGLTKREYFAAKAMQALIVEYCGKDVSELAVKYADFLLLELEKSND